MLSEEQAKQIKKQILEQIKSWPADQQAIARQQIEKMNAEELEEFLIKNKLIKGKQETGEKEPKSQEQPQQTQCPFCLINEGKIESYKIDENKQAIAVLEINPISKGHTIIIPKKHESKEKLPTQAFTLAKKIAVRLKTKLKKEKPKSIEIIPGEVFGHAVINVFPIYEKENLASERKPAKKEELAELQNLLSVKPKKEVIRIKKPKKHKTAEDEAEYIKKLPKAPERIP